MESPDTVDSDNEDQDKMNDPVTESGQFQVSIELLQQEFSKSGCVTHKSHYIWCNNTLQIYFD